MNVLEKILEEIEREAMTNKEIGRKQCEGMARAMNIIRSHMNDIPDDGWIPVGERLPEPNKKVFVTVEHSSWIADFDSEWVSEKEKTHHPETSSTYLGYINENSNWIFIDEEGQGNICDETFGTNRGRIYDVVTYWQLLPEPYKPKKLQTEEKPVQ